MSYVDFFCLPIKEENLEAYNKTAQVFATVMSENGMLQYWEASADDVPKGDVTDFFRAVKADETETVVAGFATWPDKATRDKGWEAMMKDPRCADMKPENLPFDGKRMFWGGFKPFIQKDNRN